MVRDVGGVRSSLQRVSPTRTHVRPKSLGELQVEMIVAHLDGQDGFGALEREGEFRAGLGGH